MSGDPRFEALRGQRWFHTIDLPDGTATPGVFDTRSCARDLDWPALGGLRCLDIGTCDGFWAFEMERRGAAEVLAIDVDARSAERFALAANALGSRVRRIPCSVHDLDPAVHGTFDFVFWGTLLIHLSEPTRALETMRTVCRGQVLFVECVDARPGSNASRPDTAGFLAMLRLAGFEVVSTSAPFWTPMGASARSSIRGRLGAARSPLIARILGLAFGSYDVAVRAKPRLPLISAPA